MKKCYTREDALIRARKIAHRINRHSKVYTYEIYMKLLDKYQLA